MMDVTSYDGVIFNGKLALPDGEDQVPRLVIFVNGSGANTYDNKRTGFLYFDLFREQFTKSKTAFVSYSTRGCTVGEAPPMYVDIDCDLYKTYLPLNSVEDIYAVIKRVKAYERLRNSKVYLLGWSEGTVIAPLVAEKYPHLVDGLLLAGYVNQGMKDVLKWQNDGSSQMIWYKHYFETDELGRISRQAYEADPYNVVESVFNGMTFDVIDIDKDGFISKKDLSAHLSDAVGYTYEKLLDSVYAGNDDWLRSNYGGNLITLTSGWFLQHFSLRPNFEVLPKLDLPIHIFHGTMDQNADVDGVYGIKKSFDSIGKTNLTIHVFPQHNHDLNFMEYIQNGRISEGLKSIFNTVNTLD